MKILFQFIHLHIDRHKFFFSFFSEEHKRYFEVIVSGVQNNIGQKIFLCSTGGGQTVLELYEIYLMCLNQF